ncbi:MAG: UvrD-helicase domain-containing protein, partial [Thermonemataceae bacterium]|nr:UvrD-helicase domain-containing protein [Thermonemataceae bacterium]
MFIIYTSSAGSGKTYTLSKEYLRLALGVDPQSSTFNPQYFRKILAITFTKDAAKEMKQRVLGKLLAFTENKDLFLQQELCQALGISLQELQQRAKLVFQQVIYHYSDFAVSTIDSFNNRLIAAFTQEINIPMNYQLDMDVESLTNNAADRLIAQLGEKDKEEITEFVLNFVIDEIREGSSWKDLHKKLSEYTKNLYKEESRPIAHKISQRKLKDYSSVIADLKSFLKVFKRSLKVKKEAFLEIIADNHLKLDDFSQGSKGLPTFINKLNLLEAGKLDKDLFNSYVLSMFKEQKWYAQKSKKASIIDGISEDLGIILRAIYDEWE